MRTRALKGTTCRDCENYDDENRVPFGRLRFRCVRIRFKNALVQQPPFPPATALSSSNRPFLQQPPFPCHGPLLFVIPSEAERICGAPFVCPAPTGPQPRGLSQRVITTQQNCHPVAFDFFVFSASKQLYLKTPEQSLILRACDFLISCGGVNLTYEVKAPAPLSAPWTGAPCLRRYIRRTTWVERDGRSPSAVLVHLHRNRWLRVGRAINGQQPSTPDKTVILPAPAAVGAKRIMGLSDTASSGA